MSYKSNYEKAHDLYLETESILKSLEREWSNKLNEIRRSASYKSMESPLELMIHLSAVISVRDEFGENYNELITRLDNEGTNLTMKDDDPRILIEITRAIDRVFSESEGLNIGFEGKGKYNGKIGDTDFSMSPKSETIKKSWHYKYDHNSGVSEILRKEREVKQKLLIQKQNEEKTEKEKAQIQYDQAVALVNKENEIIKRAREEKIQQKTAGLDSRMNEQLNRINDDYKNKKEAVLHEQQMVNQELNLKQQEYDNTSSIHMIIRKRLKKEILQLSERLRVIGVQIQIIEQDHHTKTEKIKSEYDSDIKKMIDSVNDKNPLRKMPEKPKILWTEYEKTAYRLQKQKEQFENQILDYLLDVGTGRSANELQDEMYLDSSRQRIENACQSLLKKGKVEVDVFKGVNYYSYKF